MEPPLFESRAGRLRGVARGGLSVFRGVPYARPPTGPLRWCPPAAPEPWAGVRDATRPGPIAPQFPGVVSRLLGMGETEMSEDSLTLDVYTPACDAARRPVLVWIHGGSFSTGAGSWPVYDGSALARRGDAVVVTCNYRLGALGWLVLPGGEGCPGLLDQIAVLEWVRDHAAGLGGDPDNVTLFGSSAGAMSVATLLAVPRARGLFQRAILQSGAARHVHEPETAQRVAECFAGELGKKPDDVDALRRAPLADVLGAQARTALALRDAGGWLPFQPVVDGELLPELPLEALRAGRGLPVPIVVGTNRDEWRFYGLTDPKAFALDEAGLERRLRRILPDVDPALLIECYRDARDAEKPSATELWFAIQTDRWFRQPAIALAQAHRACVHAYLFTWPSPADGGLGACHALELPFVFGLGEQTHGLTGQGPEAEALSANLQDAWLAFARDGEPRAPGLPRWDAYAPPERRTLELGARCAVLDAPEDAQRAFWQSLS